jgi:hypothetical protein
VTWCPQQPDKPGVVKSKAGKTSLAVFKLIGELPENFNDCVADRLSDSPGLLTD